MKTPPLLLFAALLFWGWQSHLLVEGVVAGAIVESCRLRKLRWDLDDADFHRIWTFCILMALFVGGYIFTTNEEGGFSAMFHGEAGSLRNAAGSSNIATTSAFRWLPLIFFPFVVAQVYNVRPTVPLTAVSLVLRLRRRRGEQSLAGRYLDISYPYFILCIFAAGIHANQAGHSYFWGQLALILWALWELRSRRFGLKSWAVAGMVVLALGLLGQTAIGGLEQLLQNMDARLLARFMHSRTDPSRSITSIGQIGELKMSSRIVVRLESDRIGNVPSYLHEASYRRYNPGTSTWLSGGSINDFFGLQPEADNMTWRLIPGRNPPARVTIACYLEGHSEGGPQGVLPLPPGVCALENLPAGAVTLQTNHTGVVLASGLGLMIFDARYGPGVALDSKPGSGTNHLDLDVPAGERPALDQVIGGLNLTNASDLQKRAAVAAFFTRNFTYSVWQTGEKMAKPAASSLSRFLLTSRSGHCEYFASATVLLMRELGVPARYSVGYYVHETAGSGYVVRDRDAHAWCLVWNGDTRTWDDLDTTPASWVAVEDRSNRLLQGLSDLRSWLWFQFEKLRWRQAHLRQYILWTMVPVILVLVYYIVFHRSPKIRIAGSKAIPEIPIIWPGHDSAFYRLEHALAARGLPREPSETLVNWLERALAEPSLAGLRDPLCELLKLHYRYRFDPRGLNDAEKIAFLRNADAINVMLSQVEFAVTQDSD